ncbi:MAG: DUF393 domain-containing protein [Gemmataceae bacterium]|nr:DUF393 domain-containing protein [Gemmataceae bacterium]
MSTAVVPAPAPTALADPAPGKGVVLYDGKCPLCQRAIRSVRRLDWLGRLHFQDCRDRAHWPPSAVTLDMKRLLEEMHLVTPDRRHAPAGFRAFRWMAWRLPLLLPLAPLLYLPGVPWLGNKIYLWIAKHRYDLVPCDENCRVDLKQDSGARIQVSGKSA